MARYFNCNSSVRSCKEKMLLTRPGRSARKIGRCHERLQTAPFPPRSFPRTLGSGRRLHSAPRPLGEIGDDCTP